MKPQRLLSAQVSVTRGKQQGCKPSELVFTALNSSTPHFQSELLSFVAMTIKSTDHFSGMSEP